MTSGTLFKLSGIIDIKTNDANAKLSQVEKTAQKAEKSLKETGEAAEGTSGSASGLSGMLGGLSSKFMSITAVIALATKSLMEYGRVQTEVAQLGTLFVGNAKQANELAEATTKMSQALGIDKVQALSAAYKVVSTQLGSTTKEYEFATAAALKLARAGRAVGDTIDTTGVVNLLSTEIRAFRMNSADAETVADQLFKTVQLGNTDINQLASSLPQVSAVASDVGVDFKELLAIIAGASKIIPDNIQITNSLTTALAQLQNGGAGVGKTFENIYGQRFKQALAQTGSLTNLLVDFDNRLKQTGSSLAEAFGVRGLKGIQAIVTVANDINDSFAQIADSSGLVNKALAQIGDEGGLSFGQFKTEMEETLAAIGEILSPILEILIPALRNIGTALKPLGNLMKNVLTPIMQKFSFVWDTIGDALTTITSIVSDLLEAFSPLLDIFIMFYKIALWPIKLALEAIKPLLLALKPILTVIGYIMKGIGFVLKNIVWLAAKAIDLITKVATLGFGGTDFAGEVSRQFSSGGQGDLNQADELLSLGGASNDQTTAAQDFGSSSARQAGLTSAASLGRPTGTTANVTQYNNFTQPQVSVEDLQRQQREASRKAMGEIR